MGSIQVRETMKIRVKFLEEILGTAPNNEQIYRDYIHSKSPDAETLEEEIKALGVDSVVESGMTVFPRTSEDKRPFYYDYQVKGFFKDACSMLSRVGGTGKEKKKTVNESSKLTAYKKIIDGLIFVFPRQIPIFFDGDIGTCQRPLRAHTPQGERVSLVNSEAIPAGAYMEFEIKCYQEGLLSAVREWLDYGELRGFGQWRNSGKGRFSWEEIGNSSTPKSIKAA